jgi:arginase
MLEVHMIGVPFNGDGTPPEVEHPPQSLRQAGLLAHLAVSRVVRDLGDVPIPPADGKRDVTTGVLNWKAWQTVTDRVAHRVAEVIGDGGWPLVLGGDCSVLTGIMAGVARVHEQRGLFFVDGHGDFHSPDTSPMGEPADMELAVLTGRGPVPFRAAPWRSPLLRDEDVVVFGIREWDGIEASSIRIVDRGRLVGLGIIEGAREGINTLQPDLPLWLHFDVDVLDPAIMPVIFPAGAGLSMIQAKLLLRTLLETDRVIGMDVACFHPNLDRTGTATEGLVGLLADVLAH